MKKSFVKSKTIWGAIIAVLPSLLPMVGISLSPDEIGLIGGVIDQLITIAGGALAVIGRANVGDLTIK